MKILVCTDGSKQSVKAIKEAAKIAEGCNVDEVAILHVYENRASLPYWGEGTRVTTKDLERYRELIEQEKEKRRKMLSESVEFFRSEKIKVSTIFKEGHPADTIAQVAADEKFDMVVIGSRGLGGLKKLFLGSVSNAVTQEVKTSVLVVK